MALKKKKVYGGEFINSLIYAFTWKQRTHTVMYKCNGISKQISIRFLYYYHYELFGSFSIDTSNIHRVVQLRTVICRRIASNNRTKRINNFSKRVFNDESYLS